MSYKFSKMIGESYSMHFCIVSSTTHPILHVFCRVPLRPLPKPDIHPIRRVALAIESLRYKYGFVKAGKDAPEPLTNYLDVSITMGQNRLHGRGGKLIFTILPPPPPPQIESFFPSLLEYLDCCCLHTNPKCTIYYRRGF